MSNVTGLSAEIGCICEVGETTDWSLIPSWVMSGVDGVFDILSDEESVTTEVHSDTEVACPCDWSLAAADALEVSCCVCALIPAS